MEKVWSLKSFFFVDGDDPLSSGTACWLSLSLFTGDLSTVILSGLSSQPSLTVSETSHSVRFLFLNLSQS